MATGRKPFQPLGMRLRSFAQRRINSYIPTGDSVQRQSLPPSWQSDAQTSLNWSEESSASGDMPMQQGISFEATEREVVVPATFLAPNPPSIQTAPAELQQPASPQMNRFQILRDIWDKYEARKAAEAEAHNSAFGNAAAQANASASTSQTTGENPPPRIQARRRRGAVVDITPPKQLPITGEETPDDSDNQDFFFVGGGEPAAASGADAVSGIQRDFDSAQGDQANPPPAETIATIQPLRASDPDLSVQRDTDDTEMVSTIQSVSYGETAPLQRAADDGFDWQPNGMIYMPSNSPITPETPTVSSKAAAPAVQPKRSDSPSYAAETLVTPTASHNPPIIRRQQADAPAVQTRRETGASNSDGYDAPESDMSDADVTSAAYAPDSSSWDDDFPSSIESASAPANDVQPDEGWKAQVTPLSAAPASVQLKRDTNTPPLDPQQNPSTTIQTKRSSPTVAAAGQRANTAPPAPQKAPTSQHTSAASSEAAASVVPSATTSSSRPAIQPKRETPASAAGEGAAFADDFGAGDLPDLPTGFADAPTTFQQAVNPTPTIQPMREVGASAAPPVESGEITHSANPPDLPAGFADAPTSFSMPVAPTIQPQREDSPAAGSAAAPAIQAKRNAAPSTNNPGATVSAPASQSTNETAVPNEMSQPVDEGWRAQVTPSQPAQTMTSTIQPKHDSFASKSDISDSSYEHWQPSAELAPEPAPDYAPPSPWKNFMSAPETEAPASPPVSRVQRKRTTSPSPAATSGNNFTGNTGSPSPASADDWGSQPYVQRDMESSDLPEQPVDVFTALFNAGMINERVTMPPSQPQNSAPSAAGSVQRQIDPNSSVPARGSVEADLLTMLNLPPDTPVAGLQSSKPQPTNAPSQPAAPSISRQMNPAGGEVQRSTGMASVGSMTPPVTTTTTVTNAPTPQNNDSPAIQREVRIDEMTTTVSPDDSSNSDAKNEVNVDKLAREVYSILRDKLRTEQERKHGV